MKKTMKNFWMIKGMGKGAFTEEVLQKCKKKGIEVVYGFCPMMFPGEGIHKFHYRLRNKFGKMPGKYYGIGELIYLLQNMGEKRTSTVNNSRRPTSIRKERNHFPTT